MLIFKAELFPEKNAGGKETPHESMSDSDEEPPRPVVENGSQVEAKEVDSQTATKRRKVHQDNFDVRGCVHAHLLLG